MYPKTPIVTVKQQGSSLTVDTDHHPDDFTEGVRYDFSVMVNEVFERHEYSAIDDHLCHMVCGQIQNKLLNAIYKHEIVFDYTTGKWSRAGEVVLETISRLETSGTFKEE